MSDWHQTWELTRREFVQRAKSRGFQVMILITAGLILAVVSLASFISPDEDPIRIATTSAAPPGAADALRRQATELDVALQVLTFPDAGTAEQGLRDGEVDAVYTGSTIVWLEEESTTTKSIIIGAAAALRFRDAAGELGLSPAELAAALTPTDLQTSIVATPDPEEEPRRIGALIGLILLYMSILIFGQFVALGVMEEKQNRVVEVVLSRVEPAQVLVGKVVGIGALGLLQLLVLGGAAWLALSLVDVADVSVPTLGAEIVVGVIFWFLLGYAMYSVLYAALGATVSRQEDLQSALLIPVILLLPGFFLGQIAGELPDSPFVVAASLIPLWSPMVMPTRAATGSVPGWQLIVAVGFVAITSYLMIRAGARIYRGAVLHVGAKVRLRDAWRATT